MTNFKGLPHVLEDYLSRLQDAIVKYAFGATPFSLFYVKLSWGFARDRTIYAHLRRDVYEHYTNTQGKC